MKDNISLEDFGTVISTQEYIIDRNNDNIISSFSYTNKNIETLKTEGELTITGELLGDEEGLRYSTNITHKMKNDTKIANIDFNSKNISRLDKYLDYIEKMLDKSIVLPAKTYRYDNATSKINDEYSVSVDVNGINITIGPVPNTAEILVDGRTATVRYNDQQLMDIYIFKNNGYRVVEIDENGINTIHDVDISSSKEYRNVELSKIKSNLGITRMIPNLNCLPTSLDNGNGFEIEYDKYGIVNKITGGNNILYEIECTDNPDDEPFNIACIHPLYYDNFDTSVKYNYMVYCVDILDLDFDDRFAKYTRQICKINEDKFKELQELLEFGENESDHPMINLCI